jgi:capsular polysaccharide export protein
MQSASDRPVVLFLKGPASTFWCQLADTLAANGARIVRINFGLGDRLYWSRRGAIDYRGRLCDFEAFVERLMIAEGVGDVLCCGDRFPYHVAAARAAARTGARFHIVENGYLRPDWLTLERDGMGAFSHFPADPEVIERIAAALPAPDTRVRFRHRFAVLAFHEVLFGLLDFFGSPFYLFRQEVDRYYNPLFEYLAWFPRIFHIRPLRARAKRVEAAAPTMRYWLMALQLQADYQIRANSHYGHIAEVLDEVFASFAAHAARDDRLVIKVHPHDNGIERWDRVADRLAETYGLVGRVEVIDGGDLGVLLIHAKGVVLVNSTVGLHALRARKPTKALGAAIYDMPGLTHQGSLDTFWTSPEPVRPELIEAFVTALAGTIQVRGDVYDPAGRRAAADEITARVLEGRVNEPGAFVDPPPRLSGASASALRSSISGG